MAIAEPGRAVWTRRPRRPGGGRRRPWLVCHADLPFGVSDLSSCLRPCGAGAPSSPRPGMAGPTWSGHRAIPLLLRTGASTATSPLPPTPEVVVRTGLAWDLDRAGDLPIMARRPPGGGATVGAAATG